MADVSEKMAIAVRHHQAGRLDQAEHSYRSLLESAPDDPAVLHSLGVLAHQRRENDLAVELLEKAIAINQNVPQFHNNLGIALKALGKFEEAVTACEKAVALEPGYAQAFKNLGNALLSCGKSEKAVQAYRKVIALKPGCAEAYNDLAIVLAKQGNYDEAMANSARAIEIKPDYAHPYNTMASTCHMRGEFDKAIENCRKALQLKPDCPEAHNNLGMTLLLKGQFEQGWAEYAWRRLAGDVDHVNRLENPGWDGCCFKGKTLLIHCEQGMGDNIQFVRYLPMVKQRGGTVVFTAGSPLADLLRTVDGIDIILEAASDRLRNMKFDYCVSVLDLPGIFGTTAETIPAKVPYIFAEPEKVRFWRSKVDGDKFKVGIAWAGSQVHDNDRNRSCLLRDFLPLSGIEGVAVYGLQKGPATRQIEELAGDITVTNFGEQFKDFTDTAAAVENMDLIISVDTAVLHLAGAMGKPAWGLLPFVPDWRWMLDRADSPWYPTIRLFRQSQWGDWADVFGRVAGQLQQLIHRRVSTD